MAVTHLSTVLLSESVGGSCQGQWWLTCKHQGAHTRRDEGSISLLSAPDTPLCFCHKALRSLQEDACLCFFRHQLRLLSKCVCVCMREWEMPQSLFASYRMNNKVKSLLSCLQAPLFTALHYPCHFLLRVMFFLLQLSPTYQTLRHLPHSP